MGGVLNGYTMNPSTWGYLSAVLIIAVFFRFSRLFSLRNLDLLMLIATAPGLLWVQGEPFIIANPSPILGYSWLFALAGLFLVRLMADPYLQRRPHLGQNLNASGLGFLCGAAFLLLVFASFSRPLPEKNKPLSADAQLLVEANPTNIAESVDGPAVPMLYSLGTLFFRDASPSSAEYTARTIAILAHLAVAIGLICVGSRLFNNMQLGLSMATLYLLLPVTAIDVTAATHVIPSALIVWSIVCFRRPVTAGILLGLACGTLFFPLFLLPLWIAFYGRRQAWRFSAALLVVGTLLLTALLITTPDPDSLIGRTIGTIKFTDLQFKGSGDGAGVWNTDNQAWRIPVIVAYAIMVVTLTIWPRRKNLEHLVTSSGAIIVGTQFWYPQEGSVYFLWFLPLLLMVIFRPRLVHLTFDHEQGTTIESQSQPLSGSSSRSSSAQPHRVHLFR